GFASCFLWCLLATAASAMLLATTNQMCREVASVPFLWILPLSFYLITFIICFDNPRWYRRAVFVPLLLMCPLVATYIHLGSITLPIPLQVAGYTVILFSCCMSCHGELARLKPSANHLTLFYLMVSLGGALGGCLVVLAAPNLFVRYYEFDLLLILCCILGLGVFVHSESKKHLPKTAWFCIPMLTIGCVLLSFNLTYDRTPGRNERTVHQSRNSYGILHVKEKFDIETNEPISRVLANGRIKHGSQTYDRETIPASYYSRFSGVGYAIEEARSHQSGPMNFGVIGLGAGAMSPWCENEDTIQYYEIDPQVVEVAKQYFSFLAMAESRGVDMRIELGDARIRMEKQLQQHGSNQFDILAVDAFSSNATPIHLLTKECFQLYLDHLSNNGVLAIHISNRFLDLAPICKNLADHFECESQLIKNKELEDPSIGTVSEDSKLLEDMVTASTWVIVSKNPNLISSITQNIENERRANQLITHAPSWKSLESSWASNTKNQIWTDDFASLQSIVKWDANTFFEEQFSKAQQWLSAVY
ncbi:MAG: fused MFS/spermidine synthase, partial [Planctomycetota bacterium]